MTATKANTPTSVLISVRAPYAELLVSGVKTHELRRRFPLDIDPGTKMLIYASGGSKSVIGECEIEKVHKLSINELWKLTCRSAMISWSEFKTYFSGLEYGYAIEIIKAKRYERPIELRRLPKYKESRPPQSFCYI